jgi:(2R)-3-sulfolactate dehydrogenase (NADP+)
VPRLSLAEIEGLAYRALTASKTSSGNARLVAASVAAAEADGIPSHGLLRLPTYCAHARSGKVDGFAEPSVAITGTAALQVNARDGFAHPAIHLALERLAPLARIHGVAAAAITNSYNSGVMGDHVERLAREGLVSIGFANAPAVIAPWGGNKPVFGTNPIAFAAPRARDDPLVIDQASSVVARGEVMLCAQRAEPIPEGWGLDAMGKPTTDPKAVLNGGSMAPSGGYKGTTLALMVELLAATLTGSLHSFEAGSLTADDGKHARLGQLFIALDPECLGPGFAERIEILCREIVCQSGVRLPGARRFAARRRAQAGGVSVDGSLLAAISAAAE